TSVRSMSNCLTPSGLFDSKTAKLQIYRERMHNRIQIGLSRTFGEVQSVPFRSGERAGCSDRFYHWQYPGTQQIELRATVHLPLHQLQPVDLAFYLPVAVLGGQRSFDAVSVLTQAMGEALEFGTTTPFHLC